MDAGLAEMDQYKVWEVVDRQPNMRVVGARWVYTRKIDGSTGMPSSYKARWVAKGHLQREGIDFNELYAAVAHKDTICHDTITTKQRHNRVRSSVGNRPSTMPSEARRYSPKRASSGTSCHARPPEAHKCWDKLSCSSGVRTENRSSLNSVDPTSLDSADLTSLDSTDLANLDSTDLTSLDSADPTSLGSTCLDGPGEPRPTSQEVLGLKV
jgi:hypothetical protein